MKKIITLLTLVFCLNGWAQCTLSLTSPTITPSGCGQSNGTITGALGTGGSGNYTYSWNGGSITSNSSYTNSAGTYSLQVNDNISGCTFTQNFTIPSASSPPPPSVSLSSSSTCVGGTITMTASPVSGTIYSWSEADGNSGTGNTYTVSNIPASPNPYLVLVSSTSGGCTSPAVTVTVAVVANPTITATSATICAGGTATLQATGANSYTWIPGGATTSSISVSPAGPTVYTVSGTAGSGCTGTTSSTVTIVPGPTISVSPSSTTICSGGSATLTANGASTYTWAPGGATTPNINVSPSSTTIYTVNGSLGTCSSFPTTVTVMVNASPSPPVLTAPTTTNNVFCQGWPTALTVNTGTTLALWYSGSTFIQWGSSYTPPGSLPVGTYTYAVKDSITTAGGCTSPPITVIVTINPSPSVTYTLVQDAAPHTWDIYPGITGGTPGYNYSWNWGDGSANSTSAYPSHTYSVAGTYSICATVTDANGCVTTYCQNSAVSRLANNNNPLSNMVYVNVLSGTSSISTITSSNEVTIYPNPSSGIIQLTVGNLQVTEIRVYDVNGRVVLNQALQPTPNSSLEGNSTTIDASGLEKGVYNVSFTTRAGIINKRLVIAR